MIILLAGGDKTTQAADIVSYLETALEENDPGLIAATLGDIARAKGMTEIARKDRFGQRKLIQRPFTCGESGVFDCIEMSQLSDYNYTLEPEKHQKRHN